MNDDVCDNLNWMENGWMDWIEWMWKVDSGAVPDLTIALRLKKVCYKVSLSENCERQSCRLRHSLALLSVQK